MGVALFFIPLPETNKANIMKKVLLTVLAAALTVGAASERAAAQQFELGARAGIGSQNMDMTFTGLEDAKSRLGWNLAAVSRIRVVGFGDGLLGAGLFFQPEVVYSQNNLKIKGVIPSAGSANPPHYDSKFNMKRVDIPLLLSLKVSIARVQAGPVFNLMNNITSPSGDLQLRTERPPMGYIVGASVDLLGLTVDGRYHGEFKKLQSNLDGGSNLHESIKGSLSSWSLGVGLMF
jgi:hypothetical protein